MKMASESKRSRRTYGKPKLRVVELATKEVLGLGCKTSTRGPDTGNPTCSLSNCTTNSKS